MRTPLQLILVALPLLGVARRAQASVITCYPADGLQSCVNSATANGTAGTVVLAPSGANNVFGVPSMIDLPSNVTIRCEAGVVIQPSAGNTIFRAQYQQNIVIEGCTLDGQGGNVYGIVMFSVNHVRLFRNTFQHFGNNAITSYPGGDWNDVEIDGNVFTSAGQPNANSGALQLLAQSGASASSNVRVHHNTCNNGSNYNTGCFKFAASSARPLKQLSVTDNVLNFASTSDAAFAIELFSSDNTDPSFEQFTIAKNIITGVWGSAQPYGISAYGIRGVISGNTIQNCFAAAIQVIGSNISVVANILSYSGAIIWNSAGVARSNVVITGNSILKSYGNAIQVLAGANGSANDGSISHNVIQTPDHGDGILVQTLSNGSLRDIHIDNNVLELPGGGSAIHSEGSGSQVQIENNRFVGITGAGLFLNSGGSAFTIRFNTFNGTGAWVQNFGTSVTRSAENMVNGTCCS